MNIEISPIFKGLYNKIPNTIFPKSLEINGVESYRPMNRENERIIIIKHKDGSLYEFVGGCFCKSGLVFCQWSLFAGNHCSYFSYNYKVDDIYKYEKIKEVIVYYPNDRKKIIHSSLEKILVLDLQKIIISYLHL